MKLFSHFADYILENGSNEYAHLSHNIKMALKIALVLCYTRPFLENQDFKIHSLLINKFIDEERVIHHEILELRKKEIGLSNMPIPDINNIESKIVHISISKSNSVPLQYKIVESLKNMADKINNAAIEIVEIPDFEHNFCFRGTGLQR